jgi:ABC-type nitrate/sulfonate/bicarbonate transport system substrate-binding protein
LANLKNRLGISTAILLLSTLLCACSNQVAHEGEELSKSHEPLRMAISPYQDTAFLVNAKELGLEKKYGTKLELLTLPWEEILPAIASAGNTVDVSYASLTTYLTKSENLNKQTDDPVLFIYPLLVFKGNGFVTFNPTVPELTHENIKNQTLVKKFLAFKIGAPKSSMGQMLLYMLAQKAALKFADIPITDITMNDGLLAAENGSLDIAAAGVPQRTEAIRRHGRVVLSADTFGVGDIIGLVCKESVYKKRQKDIDSLIKMHFDCEKYVLSDIDHHSDTMLAYLRAKASTKYTLPEFKQALTYQYFPLSVKEVEESMVSSVGKYSIGKQTAMVNQYLVDIGTIKSALSVPKPIVLSK